MLANDRSRASPRARIFRARGQGPIQGGTTAWKYIKTTGAQQLYADPAAAWRNRLTDRPPPASGS
jgi:hypothetical protein